MMPSVKHGPVRTIAGVVVNTVPVCQGNGRIAKGVSGAYITPDPLTWNKNIIKVPDVVDTYKLNWYASF